MITELHIRNFQRHRELVVQLGPGVNTILGPTDAGKSAVIRAMRWVATNRPTGEQIIRDGADRCTVAMVVDGVEVRRTKQRGGGGYYRVGKATMRAVGADVPPQVAQALQLGPVNFQGQHDAPYWFAETAGEVSRLLNAVVNLGAIDRVLAHVAGALRQARASQAVAAERVAEAEEEFRTAKGAREMDRELRAVEGLRGVWLEKRQKCPTLDAVLGAIAEHGGRADTATRAADACEAVVLAGQVWEAARHRAHALERLLVEVDSHSRLAETEIPDTTELGRLGDAVLVAAERVATAVQLVVSAEQWEADACRAKQTAERTAAELAKRMGKRCPLCQQPIR